MTDAPFVNLRSLLVRGFAVLAVLSTYALGNIGTQVLSAVGISTLTMTTTSTSAQAGWRHRRGRDRRSRRRRREW
jgi:hypothetical protein